MPEVEYIDILASDCSILEVSDEQIKALQAFNTAGVALNCFKFKKNAKPDEDESLLEYDYKRNKWWASRYIGEAKFQYAGIDYRLSIRPRFGELFLFRMFEEIYNIQLTRSDSQISRTNDPQFLIRKLVAFIWVQLLADANKHGVPKNNIDRQHVGTKIKGSIAVLESIRSLTRSNLITSKYREKVIDKNIAGILLQAYQILRAQYGLDLINMPDNAQEALNELFKERDAYGVVSKHIYKTIQYRDIYSAYKKVVDFSWDIIEKRNNLNQDSDQPSTKGFGLFIDMAEVWELYLRSLLKKRLQPAGWKYIDASHQVYAEMFYSRRLIPDIVFSKGGSILAFDAKYKRMYFFSQEIDRTDFFQIHTYAGFYTQEGNVAASGLLYPITTSSTSEELSKNHAKGWFGASNSPGHFIVDGIDISFLDIAQLDRAGKIALLKIKENEFINRILSAIPDDDL